MPASDLRAALAGPPDVVVSTPGCIPKFLSTGVLQSKSFSDSLKILVLDEADLLLSYGYEDDLKALTALVPRGCQCLLMSATSSSDVEKLKKLILHNPFILTLPEVRDVKDDIIPKNVQQFWISCSERDKLLYILALLKLELIQKKALIFTNTIDMGFRLKLFLEKFGIRSAILNAELPQNSRLHILEEFNAGLFDYLIATDDSQAKDKEQPDGGGHADSRKSRKNAKPKLDSEFGVVRGIDFKNVHTVINFEMPQNAAGYVHRIGRTGRAYNTGASVSLVSLSDKVEVNFVQGTKVLQNGHRIICIMAQPKVIPFPYLSPLKTNHMIIYLEDLEPGLLYATIRMLRVSPDEMEVFEEIKSFVGYEDNKESNIIAPFPLLTKNAVESLRYRAEDVAKSVTKVAVRESRAQDLRNEIINSEKLKAHFEVNPKDLDLLKHDKVLSKKPPAPHLRDVPDYLLDPTTQEARKMVKLARAAMGNNNPSRRQGSKRRSRKKWRSSQDFLR
ncbi:hypothetical protein Patl1_28468 [Pistacia atlantica]|uniref:Uncharacterized protein n=1 Tax=Pistacia atlantica TaxID=434234 RepID=A0ACC1BE87_9ROSI|nr:hypothetical protein Patl1_28468 [Pistacia atlantica]